MTKIDARVKKIVDTHLESDMSGDEDEVYLSDEEGANDEDDEEDEPMEEDDIDVEDDVDEDDDAPMLNFEHGRYERSKVLKMRGLQIDQYTNTLESDPEIPDEMYYIDV